MPHVGVVVVIVPEPFHGEGGQLLHRFTSVVSCDCLMEMPPYALDRVGFRGKGW
jgi:hypothetical protein